MGVLTKGPNGGALGGHTGGLPRVHRGPTEGDSPRCTEVYRGHNRSS